MLVCPNTFWSLVQYINTDHIYQWSRAQYSICSTCWHPSLPSQQNNTQICSFLLFPLCRWWKDLYQLLGMFCQVNLYKETLNLPIFPPLHSQSPPSWAMPHPVKCACKHIGTWCVLIINRKQVSFSLAVWLEREKECTARKASCVASVAVQPESMYQCWETLLDFVIPLSGSPGMDCLMFEQCKQTKICQFCPFLYH